MDIRQAVLDFCSYGLYIVSSHSDGKINGQISDAVMQVTAFPPKIAVSINKTELTHEMIEKSGVFGVSILSKDVDPLTIGLFGFHSGREVEKLAKVSHVIGRTGVPLVLEGCIGILEAKVIQAVDLDTHTLFVGDVLDAKKIGGTPLTYHYYRTDMRGRVPKNSPSYHGEDDAEDSVSVPAEKAKTENDAKPADNGKKYVCDTCGWVYDPALGDPEHGIAPGTPFEEIPDDWTCPLCGVGKDEFYPEK